MILIQTLFDALNIDDPDPIKTLKGYIASEFKKKFKHHKILEISICTKCKTIGNVRTSRATIGFILYDHHVIFDKKSSYKIIDNLCKSCFVNKLFRSLKEQLSRNKATFSYSDNEITVDVPLVPYILAHKKQIAITLPDKRFLFKDIDDIQDNIDKLLNNIAYSFASEPARSLQALSGSKITGFGFTAIANGDFIRGSFIKKLLTVRVLIDAQERIRNGTRHYIPKINNNSAINILCYLYADRLDFTKKYLRDNEYIEKWGLVISLRDLEEILNKKGHTFVLITSKELDMIDKTTKKIINYLKQMTPVIIKRSEKLYDERYWYIIKTKHFTLFSH